MKIESSVLRRIGPVPFWRGEKKCLDELQRIYAMAAEFAQRTLDNDGVRLEGLAQRIQFVK